MKKVLFFLFIFFGVVTLNAQSTKFEWLAPSPINAKDLVFTDATSTSLTFNWTNGNLASRIVLMKSGSAVNSDPVNSTTYTASNTFGSGSQIGTGNYVVNIGSGPVTVTGLTANIRYYVAVYGFSGSAGAESYLTSGLSPPATGNDYTFTTEYQAVLTYATGAGYSAPSVYENRVRENAHIRVMKANGTWTLADQIAHLNSFGDENFSLINIKTPGTKNLTKVTNGGALAFTAGIGWVDAGKTGYLRTHYTPSTDAVSFTTNSAGTVTYSSLDRPLNAAVTFFGSGGASVANATAITLRSSGDKSLMRLNEATAITGVAGTVVHTDGTLQMIRTGASVVKAYLEEDKIIDDVTASTGVSAAEMVLLAYNNNGSFITNTDQDLGFWMIGGAFNNTLVLSELETLFTRNVTQVTFPDWRNISSTDLSPFLTSYSSLTSVLPSPPTPSVIPKVKNTLLSPAITGGTNYYQGAVHIPESDLIYFIPSNKTTILKFNTVTETYTEFGSVGAALHKWSGGCRSSKTGKMYFCCYSSHSFLELDPVGDVIKYFDPTGYVATEDLGNLIGDTKWNSLTEGADGRLYGLPFGADANTVVIIDVSGATPVITFMDTTGPVAGYQSGNLSGSAKWDSSVVRGVNVYGCPSTISTIIKVNTQAGTCSLIGSLTVSSNRNGIGIMAYTGNIYIFPYSGPTCLKIDQSDVITTFGTFTAASIIVGGAAVLPDGKIITVCLGGLYSYLLDPATDTITELGGLPSASTSNVGLINARNGAAYSVPYDAPGNIVKVYYQYKSVTYPTNFLSNRHINKGY